jgi:hypothetical protein
MVTQFERDQMRRAKEARRLLALLEAATAVLPAIEDPDSAEDLRKALSEYHIENLRSSLVWADREDARREAEEAKVAEGKRAFDELPDSPPRRQCEAHVARDMGRWTNFGRCEKAANRIVMDWTSKRERCLCSLHAKEFVTTGKAGTGFNVIGKAGVEEPTHESWYRIHGWCMEPDPKPDPRKPARYCKVKVEIGSGRHEGKDHRYA